ncbi:hypothetical protein KY331_04545 [Candidatus Woesearchaeota archaeon]|nr:hypothetical protein [Candidatus Woesearchaeota archaeon]
MEEVIRQNIIVDLRKAIPAIKKEDVPTLKELSNQTIKDVSILQSRNLTLVAIIIYSLSKIIARSEQMPNWWGKTKSKIIKDIDRARSFLEKNKQDDYKVRIKKVLKNIGKVDKSLQLYIEDVLDKAKIIKGAKLYEQGLSVGRAAEFLDISQWELMSYVGKTKIIDRYEEEVIPVSVRLDHAKKAFNIK